jgi:protein-tyrosine phosphatase
MAAIRFAHSDRFSIYHRSCCQLVKNHAAFGRGICCERVVGEGSWEFEDVEEVLWVEGDPTIKLAIVLCPRGDAWLKDNLREIKRSGVETLVSLLEPHEAIWLGLGDERQLAEEVGLTFLSYPIRDVHVPPDIKSFRAFCAGLADRLRAGEHIGLHCRGSIGRAPTTAACTLVHLGWKAKDALSAIQAARGYPIPDTEEQLRWILHYKAQP